MIVFHSVKYKNFLATGNVWNEYTLDKHPTTLLVGTNGSGKSSLLDAICFGLYGKAFRDINKATLVNTINEKNLVVEIEFSTQNNRYLVRRGIKPSIFDIEVNGKAIDEMPSVNEMQDYLEQYVLKCNFKAFTQVVILGAASYVPFMRLTPAARREILEDVLDIEVFSVMHSLVKGRLKQTQEDLRDAQSELAVILSQHELAQTYAEQWTQQQEARRKNIDTQLAQLKTNADQWREDLTAATTERASLEDVVLKIPTWQDQHTKATNLVTKFETEKAHLDNSHKFFDEHDQCPTCTQIIDATFKSTQLDSTKTALLNVSMNLDEVRGVMTTLSTKLQGAKEAQRRYQAADVQVRRLEERLSSVDRDLARLTTEREATFASAPPPPTELGDVDAARKTVEELTYTKQIQEQANTLLKDAGIRTRIIQQYIPTINANINKYLQFMNFPVQFTLNDKFVETIKSRHRDIFTYENFSEGEKRRIDLALVLTWRDIARLKNSASTNIIIFDEIFDSSLDASGTDDFLTLVQSMGSETNAIVISHKVDQLIDKFPHVVMVEKSRGFSIHTVKV